RVAIPWWEGSARRGLRYLVRCFVAAVTAMESLERAAHGAIRATAPDRRGRARRSVLRARPDNGGGDRDQAAARSPRARRVHLRALPPRALDRAFSRPARPRPPLRRAPGRGAAVHHDGIAPRHHAAGAAAARRTPASG